MNIKDASRYVDECIKSIDAGEFRGAITAGLKKLIEKARSELRPEVFASWQAEKIAGVYLSWKRWKGHAPGVDRAIELHKSIDGAIERQFSTDPTGKLVQCRRGCSFCCHIEVTVTDDEAKLLAERVRGGVGVDINRVRALASLEKDSFNKLPFEERKCVFLGEDKACRVYEDRPATCRAHMVVSDPRLCEDMDGESAQVILHEAQITLSGALNACEKAGTLPALLLIELEKTPPRETPDPKSEEEK